MKAYLGADWSASSVVCATVGAGGEARGIKGAEPSLSAVRDLVERVRARHPGHEVHVVIEAGGEGWARLFHAAGVVVHVVDPKQAKRYGESLHSSGAKDDARDSQTLALMGLSPAHLAEPWLPESEVRWQLDTLASGHEQLTSDLGRAQQRLREHLREHMPLVNAAVHDVTTGWAAKLLRRIPTPWHARGLTRVAFDELLAKSGVRGKSRETVWDALGRTDAPWFTEVVAEAIALRVRQLLDLIASLSQQLEEVDRRIDALTRPMNIRTILETVDGIGLNLAVALILFGMGDDVVSNRDEAAIRMGASPVFSGSGKTSKGRSKGHARMRRAAPSRARRSTYLLGRLASQHLDWATAMYNHGRQRGQSAATAYRRIARSVLRIVSAMVRDNQPYDNARYVAALRAKRVAWATSIGVAAAA